MADDPSQSVADSKASSDPNIIPATESASSDSNRPVSTILADSPTEPKIPLADSGSDYTAPVPADLSGGVSAQTDSPIATESASIISSPNTVPADESTEASAKVDSQPTVPDESSVATQSATVATESPGDAIPPPPPPDPTEGGSIQDSLPPDQPSQVQPEAPVSAPSPQASQEPKTAPQSAEIKPEPPEGTQNAPLADFDSQKSSFGDILEGTGEAPAPVTPISVPIQPPSPPVSEPISSTPKTSFGDLVGIPPTEEPTINIVPIEAPKPSQPPQSPPPSQSPLPAEALAKEGQSPISPSSLQPQTEKVIEAKADFSAKRKQALQTRRNKREDHLAKILALISQKGKINNKDICDLLRVSQSTATNYLHSLVKDGKIKKEGKAKATVYK